MGAQPTRPHGRAGQQLAGLTPHQPSKEPSRDDPARLLCHPAPVGTPAGRAPWRSAPWPPRIAELSALRCVGGSTTRGQLCANGPLVCQADAVQFSLFGRRWPSRCSTTWTASCSRAGTGPDWRQPPAVDRRRGRLARRRARRGVHRPGDRRAERGPSSRRSTVFGADGVQHGAGPHAHRWMRGANEAPLPGSCLPRGPAAVGHRHRVPRTVRATCSARPSPTTRCTKAGGAQLARLGLAACRCSSGPGGLADHVAQAAAPAGRGGGRAPAEAGQDWPDLTPVLVTSRRIRRLATKRMASPAPWIRALRVTESGRCVRA